MVANLPNSRIVELLKGGIEFINTNTSFPSDSFPGTAGILTGASPKTHGFWYDVAYSRALYPPGSGCQGRPGSDINYDESVDIDFNANLHLTVTSPDGGCPGYQCKSLLQHSHKHVHASERFCLWSGQSKRARGHLHITLLKRPIVHAPTPFPRIIGAL